MNGASKMDELQKFTLSHILERTNNYGYDHYKENTYLKQHRNESMLHESTVLLHLAHKHIQEKDTRSNSLCG